MQLKICKMQSKNNITTTKGGGFLSQTKNQTNENF